MTTGAQIFDRLCRQSVPPEPESEALVRLAEQMVATSIKSGQMLRELRERMFPMSDNPAALEVAHALRAEFLQWADEADAVFERASKLRQSGRSISGSEELGDLIGMTRAMLQITPEAHLQAVEQIRRGETVPIDEVRRELRLRTGR